MMASLSILKCLFLQNGNESLGCQTVTLIVIMFKSSQGIMDGQYGLYPTKIPETLLHQGNQGKGDSFDIILKQ